MPQNGAIPVAELENSNFQTRASKAMHPNPLKGRRKSKYHATKTFAPGEASITQLTNRIGDSDGFDGTRSTVVGIVAVAGECLDTDLLK